MCPSHDCTARLRAMHGRRKRRAHHSDQSIKSDELDSSQFKVDDMIQHRLYPDYPCLRAYGHKICGD